MAQVKLTPEQYAANRKAIHSYIIGQVKANGGVKNAPVILVPAFEEDTDGEWYPVQSNGVRPTTKEGFSFMRLGTAFIKTTANGNMEVGFHMTNTFNDEQKLIDLLDLTGTTIGSQLPDCKLVVEESLNPFRKTGGEADIKYAGTSGIACTFTGEHNGVVYDSPAPIYRRVKCAPLGSKDVLIAHTNTEEISKYQAAQWAQANKPQTAGIKAAAATTKK